MTFAVGAGRFDVNRVPAGCSVLFAAAAKFRYNGKGMSRRRKIWLDANSRRQFGVMWVGVT